MLLFVVSPPLPRQGRPHHALPTCQRRPRCCASESATSITLAPPEAAQPPPDRVRFRSRLAYDGTNYCGWQWQPREPTVQAAVERQLSRKLNGAVVRVVGASRTDSGVHARGQVAHFDMPVEAAAAQLGDAAKIDNFQFTMNRMLPPDIRMYDLEVAPCVPKRKRGEAEDSGVAVFNAIYDVSAKLYSYRVSVARTPDPLERQHRFHDWRGVSAGFQRERLQRAATVFVGSHDFTAFTNAGPKVAVGDVPAAVVRNPVRTVRSVTVVDETAGGEGRFRVDFVLEGALFRMVRNMMGAILEVGAGRLEAEDVQRILEARDRQFAPRGSPAHGLCLERVYFDH
jgi:tRNA pseudouridine38-40 synthase